LDANGHNLTGGDMKKIIFAFLIVLLAGCHRQTTDPGMSLWSLITHGLLVMVGQEKRLKSRARLGISCQHQLMNIF